MSGRTSAMLRRVPGLFSALRMLRTLGSPIGRGRLHAQLRGAALFQPETLTRADRHPALFRLVAAHVANRAAPRLLSFGCSTGEEAFTLARHLPDATILGIDANPACIAAARRGAAGAGRHHIDFLCADSPDAAAPARYDAIMCLSVLRHAELDARRPALSTALVPFTRFAEAVAALDRRLDVGGMLLLWGCNFRFTDTVTAERYRVVPVPEMRAQPGPFYGLGDRRLDAATYAAFAFVKLAEA